MFNSLRNQGNAKSNFFETSSAQSEWLQMTNANGAVETGGPLVTAGKNANWFGHYSSEI